MAFDLAQAQLDERVRAAGAQGRMRLHGEMYRQAFRLVWAQADRAGEMTELERARFLLRRLYPDLEGPRLESIMRRLSDEFAAGTWTGVTRPGSTDATEP